MGNSFNMKTQLPPPNSVVKIIHDKYSEYQEIPDDIMKIGQYAKVIKSENLYQSRKEFPTITIAKLQFKDGTQDTYIATNLQVVPPKIK